MDACIHGEIVLNLIGKEATTIAMVTFCGLKAWVVMMSLSTATNKQHLADSHN